MKRMQQRVLEFPSQRGNLWIFHSEVPEGRYVSIYGDPEGLRSFAALLIAEADVDQSQLPERSLSLGGRHHLHILAGVHIHPRSMDAVIGRLDAAKSGEFPDWLRNTRIRKGGSIRQGLDGGAVIRFPRPWGRLLVFHCQDQSYRAVGIYGDPDGLRSFGKLLIAEGDLDQTQFPGGNLPDSEGHHLQVEPSVCIHPQSIPVVLGRLDTKVTGEMREWLSAPHFNADKARPVRQALFETEQAGRRSGSTRIAPSGL